MIKMGGVINTNFKRIDINNPSTILSYCDDVKDAISNILESTAQMSAEKAPVVLEDKLIKEITGFDESLDESEKLAKKKQLPVVSGIRNLLTKFGVEKFKKQDDMATYKGRYLDYCDKIQQVVEAVEAQKQASLGDIELRKRIVEEIMPLIEQMEEMIKVAIIDRDNFAKEIEELKKQPQDLDTQYMVQYKSQILEVFNGKINELEKALVVYKNQIQQYRVQQATEMKAVMSADSYIKDTSPILKAQGSVMLFNREQNQRLERLNTLNDAANVALVQNASELADNASLAVDLSLNNGIQVSTIEELVSYLEKGVKIFQDGRILQQQQIEADKMALSKLNEQLDSYQKEILGLIDDKEVMAGVLEDKTGRNLPMTRSLTKRPNKKS